MGWQYARGTRAALLAEQGAAASLSRQGDCHDNALPESLACGATRKAECFAGERPPTRQAAKLQLFGCVGGFY